MGIDSATPQDLLPRASILIDLGRHQEAIRLLQDALRREPDNARALCFLSLAYLRLKRNRESMAAARQALLTNPENEWPHRLLSVGLMQAGKKKEALFEAQECVRLAPALPHTLTALIQAQIAVKDLANAADTANRLLALAPEESGTHFQAGNVALAYKDWRGAEERYRRALSIDPQNADALCNLGIALHHQHKSIDAFDHLYEAVRRNPQDEQAQRILYNVIERYVAPLRLSGVPGGLLMVFAIIPQVRAVLVLMYVANNTVVRWSRTRDLSPELRRFHRIYQHTHFRRRRRFVRTILVILAIVVVAVLAIAVIATFWHG